MHSVQVGPDGAVVPLDILGIVSSVNALFGRCANADIHSFIKIICYTWFRENANVGIQFRKMEVNRRLVAIASDTHLSTALVS